MGFTGKESKGISVSREIIYANLIDYLHDLFGYDRNKYDLVLKVVYQFGGGIIAPTVITNDDDLSFFLDEISISIQHRTPLCVSVVERTTPPIPNPTQYTHCPLFVPETAEAEKLYGLEEFHACIDERVDQNCNDAYEKKVDLDDNYDQFSQLRSNKNFDEVRRKHSLQIDVPVEQPEGSPENKTPGTASSGVPKIINPEGDKTMFTEEELLGDN